MWHTFDEQYRLDLGFNLSECVDIERKNNNIIGYMLRNIDGNITEIKADVLKDNIKKEIWLFLT